MHPPKARDLLAVLAGWSRKNLPPGEILDLSAELTSYPQPPRTILEQ
jgi:hypothetical protein